MPQEIIINASATAAKEILFVTFDVCGGVTVPTSLSTNDLRWRTPDSTLVTAAGVVSLVGGNIFRYLPTQAEVSVAGKAAFMLEKTSIQRVYELIDIKGPAFPAPLYAHDVGLSVTAARVPFRIYDAYTRLPATGLTFSAAEVFIAPNVSAFVTAGGSVTEVGNGVYAYLCTATDVSGETTNLLQIRKPGYHSEGAIFNVYTSLQVTGNRLVVDTAALGTSAITPAAMTSAVYEAIADNVLSRRIKPGASGTRTVGEALAMLRNRVVRTETGYSVYDIDDTSVLYSGSVTTSLSSTPLTEMNPV